MHYIFRIVRPLQSIMYAISSARMVMGNIFKMCREIGYFCLCLVVLGLLSGGILSHFHRALGGDSPPYISDPKLRPSPISLSLSLSF